MIGVPMLAGPPNRRSSWITGRKRIGGLALLLAGRIQPQRWSFDAVRVTSLGLCCCSRGGAYSIVGHLMVLVRGHAFCREFLLG